MTADLLQSGKTAIVEKILEGECKINLLEMGVLPGKKITFLNKAPWGGPIAFQIEGNMIAIRRSEAKCIEISMTGK